jgi:RHS repeat-associated protein
MDAAFLGPSTITSPSGLQRVATHLRQATLTDPTNPLTLETLVDYSTISGHTSTATFDAATRTQTVRSPEGRTYTIILDAHEHVVQEQIAGLAPIAFTYDAQGRVMTRTQGSRVWTFTYGTDGFLASTTDPLLRTTFFDRDTVGRITTVHEPGFRDTSFSYDGNSNRTVVTPPGRTAHTFAYDEVNEETRYQPPTDGLTQSGTVQTFNLDRNITNVALPDGRALQVAYDPAGRVSSVTQSEGTTTYAYDPITGAVSSITSADGVTTSYVRDGALTTRTTLSGPIASRLDWTYDQSFRVASVAVQGTPAIAYVYDRDDLAVQVGDLAISYRPDNRLPSATTLGIVSDERTYDPFGAVAAYVATAGSSTLFAETFSYDSGGRIARKIESVQGTAHTTDYGYDAAGRLASVTIDGAAAESFTYDANGNRLTHATATGATIATYDAQDRLITAGGNFYTYNATGQLTSRTATATGQMSSFDYDVSGDLRRVVLPTGRTIEYVVDGLGRRVARRVNGVFDRGFVWSGGRLVAELDENQVPVARFVYGSSRVPDYMIAGGQSYRLVTDQVGSVRLVVDASTGAIAQRLDYDGFGAATLDSSPGFQPFGFAGGLYDVDTGLVRFGARDYDALVGRWNSKDPLRFQGGGTNLYTYVEDDPGNRTDPTGRIAFVPLLAAAIIAAGIDIFFQVRESGGDYGAIDPGRVAEAALLGAVALAALEFAAPLLGLAGPAGAAQKSCTEGGGPSGLGDLTVSEAQAIQDVVNKAGRPLEVVGSAARAARGPASDIDYVAPPGSLPYFEGLESKLPGIDPSHGIIPGVANPNIGPSIRFVPQ